jgi:lipopolysaccharide export system protein LptA
MSRARLVRLALPGLLLALSAGLGAAQPAQQSTSSNMAQGLTANSGQPVKIESTSLEVRDKSRIATFTGNVKMTQGDNVVQCKVLVVFYEDSSAPSPNVKSGPAIASPGGGKQQIKRMECKGDALITQKDQTASGDHGVFEVKANTLTLTGKVVVTQGQNVLKGEKMVINMTTGVTKVESGKDPVMGIILPNQKDQKDMKSAPTAVPPAPAAPAKSSGPMRIN